jgi:hypothetical protein
MPWEQARDAVKDGYDRSMQIRKERERAASEPCDWMHADWATGQPGRPSCFWTGRRIGIRPIGPI